MNGKLTKTLCLLAASVTSGAVLAHAGAHGQEGFLSGVLHILGEHGYLLLLVAAALGGAQLTRRLRA